MFLPSTGHCKHKIYTAANPGRGARAFVSGMNAAPRRNDPRYYRTAVPGALLRDGIVTLDVIDGPGSDPDPDPAPWWKRIWQ